MSSQMDASIPLTVLQHDLGHHLQELPQPVVIQDDLTPEQTLILAEQALEHARKGEWAHLLTLPDGSQKTVEEVVEYFYLGELLQEKPQPGRPSIYPITWRYSDLGDLVITRQADYQPADLETALRALIIAGRFQWVQPEEVAALTSAPILASEAIRDEAGVLVTFADLFWYPGYEVIDPLEALMCNGSLIFAKAPDDPLPPEVI